MMVGVAVLVPDEGDHLVISEVTGMVGIAGPLSATFSLRCSFDTATRIAAQMLAIPIEEAASQKCDAIGEVCNMVAGSFKEKIGLGGKCMLSVPTVLTGRDYQIRSRSVYVRVELPLIAIYLQKSWSRVVRVFLVSGNQTGVAKRHRPLDNVA